LRVVHKYRRLESIPLDHGTGDRLFPVETHTVEAIGNHPGTTVTLLANTLGVTKGAVSQTLVKLLRKGLVERRPDPEDAKTIHLHLTKQGKTVFTGHAKFHARYDAEVVKALLELDDSKFMVLRRFMELTEHTLDTYLRELT